MQHIFCLFDKGHTMQRCSSVIIAAYISRESQNKVIDRRVWMDSGFVSTLCNSEVSGICRCIDMQVEW